ncbi:ABC transporter substrate-binding protein [Salipaludibacillus sp. HK11]|uniref:ABC transporter substrate-binding protein n=1 Tax=Salipaludibacillus sp. HK11 TaxID=3394320 RepID=UPI0039FCC9B7
MMKSLNLIVCLSLFTLLVAGCSGPEEKGSASSNLETLELTLMTPKAPVLIPALFAAEHKDDSLEITVETWDTLEELLAHVQNGEFTFVAAPLNIGANIYTKGLPLELVHVNTWGSMYLISLSSNVMGIADLRNETVYIPGQGGPPDLLTTYMLEQDGLLKEVEIVYSTVPEIMQLLASGDIEHAVLPEPLISRLRSEATELTEVIDFGARWQEKFGESLPQTGMFVNSEWAKVNQEKVEQFEKSLELAINQTVSDPNEAIRLSANVFGLPDEILLEAMDSIELRHKGAYDAKEEVESYFQVLMDVDPDSLGGRLPDEDFYYDF